MVTDEPAREDTPIGQGRAPGRAPVVVGVDGSPESAMALHDARRLARLLDAPLEVLMAWQLPAMAYATFPAVADWSPGASARDALEAVVTAEFGTELPDWLHAFTAAGSAAQVLLDAGRGARLMVVGRRGHGGFSGLLLGSVSEACARHADCPVLVVRPWAVGGDTDDDTVDRAVIVVGVDGSAQSVNALRVAADLAQRLGCRLRVALVWQEPRFFAGGRRPELPWSPAEDAEEALRRCLEDAFGAETPEGVTASTYHGRAAEVLIDCAVEAHMLVVGSRGRGGFASLMLGSVAEACVRHSISSVLVVHGDAHRFSAGTASTHKHTRGGPGA